MDFPNIPESITRAARDALITSLGLKGLDHLRMLEFRPDGIYAELLIRGEHGIQIDPYSNELLTHKVYIPVRD